MSQQSVTIDFAFDDEIDTDVYNAMNHVEKTYDIKGEIVKQVGPTGWPLVRWIGTEENLRWMTNEEYDDFDGELYTNFLD